MCLSLPVISLWIQPRVFFVCAAAAAHCWLMFNLLYTKTSSSLSARLLPCHKDPNLTGLFGYSVPSAGLRTCLSWNSYCSCYPTLPACPSLSVRWLTLLTWSHHHPVWCHLQTWWGCFQSHHPGHLWRCWTGGGPVSIPRGPTCDRLPTWVKTIDYHPLSATS